MHQQAPLLSTSLHELVLVDWSQYERENVAKGAFLWPSWHRSASARGHHSHSIPPCFCGYKYLPEFSEKRYPKNREFMVVCCCIFLWFLIFSLCFKVRAKQGSPYPQRLEADLFDLPAMDLKYYLTKKRSVHQITPQCCCERLITAVLSECRCSSLVSKQSVFNRLSSTLVSRSANRRRSRTRRAFSDVEYPEVTTNMVGSSTTPNRTKGKQPIVSPTCRHQARRSVPAYPHSDWCNSPNGLQCPNLGNWSKRDRLCIAESQASNSSI